MYMAAEYENRRLLMPFSYSAAFLIFGRPGSGMFTRAKADTGDLQGIG
jgi:hypothetical protein